MRNTVLSALASIFTGTAASAGVNPVPMGKNAVLPADPCAGPISYSNIELLYERTSFDAGDLNHADGGVLRCEYGFRHFHVGLDAAFSSYKRTAFFDSWNIDQWKARASIGSHVALRDNIHLAGEAGFVFLDLDSSDRAIGATIARRGPNRSDTGWFVRPHLRAKWGCVTVHAGSEYEDISGDGNWSAFGRVYYQIAPKWDLTLGGSAGEDADALSCGVRWRF